jgi:hypothetical protein
MSAKRNGLERLSAEEKHLIAVGLVEVVGKHEGDDAVTALLVVENIALKLGIGGQFSAAYDQWLEYQRALDDLPVPHREKL